MDGRIITALNYEELYKAYVRRDGGSAVESETWRLITHDRPTEFGRSLETGRSPCYRDSGFMVGPTAPAVAELDQLLAIDDLRKSLFVSRRPLCAEMILAL